MLAQHVLPTFQHASSVRFAACSRPVSIGAIVLITMARLSGFVELAEDSCGEFGGGVYRRRLVVGDKILTSRKTTRNLRRSVEPAKTPNAWLLSSLPACAVARCTRPHPVCWTTPGPVHCTTEVLAFTCQ